MTHIELNKQNLLGKGSYAAVYSHEIENTKLAVKCFEKKDG